MFHNFEVFRLLGSESVALVVDLFTWDVLPYIYYLVFVTIIIFIKTAPISLPSVPYYVRAHPTHNAIDPEVTRLYLLPRVPM